MFDRVLNTPLSMEYTQLPVWTFLCPIHMKYVPLTVSYDLYFFRLSKVSSMLHEGSVGRGQNKGCYFMFSCTFLEFFVVVVVLHHKICVFIIFISSILTSQKQELVIRNCQWNCLYALVIARFGYNMTNILRVLIFCRPILQLVRRVK